MPGKVIIYTGAPESGSLDWAPEGLLSSFDPSIAEFTGITKRATNPTPAPQPTAPNYAEWRSLSLEPARLHTGFSQQYASYPDQPPHNHDTEFFTTSFSTTGDPLDADDQSLLSQFYETSIAAHNQDVPTSQLVPAAEESQLTTTSFNTTSSFTSASPAKDPLPTGLPAPLALSDLSSLPSARHLTAIHPQTMTCHLVVGLISLAPPRAVQTRFGTSHLTEVLVGDETRAGFAVTFWLGSSPTAGAGALLATLRPGDVVLLQNVALNAFRSRVYGSSLRRGMTKAYLLYRATGEREGEGGYYDAGDLRRGAGGHAQLEKTKRVRDWVVRFVGSGEGEGKRKGKRAWDVMPDVDETQ